MISKTWVTIIIIIRIIIIITHSISKIVSVLSSDYTWPFDPRTVNTFTINKIWLISSHKTKEESHGAWKLHKIIFGYMRWKLSHHRTRSCNLNETYEVKKNNPTQKHTSICITRVSADFERYRLFHEVPIRVSCTKERKDNFMISHMWREMDDNCQMKLSNNSLTKRNKSIPWPLRICGNSFRGHSSRLRIFNLRHREISAGKSSKLEFLLKFSTRSEDNWPVTMKHKIKDWVEVGWITNYLWTSVIYSLRVSHNRGNCTHWPKNDKHHLKPTHFSVQIHLCDSNTKFMPNHLNESYQKCAWVVDIANT